jgi:hypothetical protein
LTDTELQVLKKNGASSETESAVFFGFIFFWGVIGVYIRCCGNGCLWFRSYSGSLLEERQK